MLLIIEKNSSIDSKIEALSHRQKGYYASADGAFGAVKISLKFKILQIFSLQKQAIRGVFLLIHG